MRDAVLLTPVRPDPHGVGPAKRAHQWLLALARDYRVHVLVVGRGPEGDMPPNPEAASEARYALGPHPRARGALNVLAWSVGQGSRLAPGEWVAPTPALGAWLEARLAGADVARLVCFRLSLAELGRWLADRHPGAATTLDLDDLEPETRLSIARDLLGQGRPLRALVVRAGVPAWRASERSWAPRFGEVAVCCEADRETAAARLPGTPVVVRPNRLWRGAIAPPTAQPPSPRAVLFVGSLAYAPNESAALFFARRVMPLLRAMDPTWTFTVVGRGGTEALGRRLRRCEGVTVAGDVPDVAPYYARAAIVVAPLRAGGGTKLKVLEAAAHGRPLVATREAQRGLDLVAGDHLLAAESAGDFADACRALAADPALAMAIAVAARAHVQAHYTYGEEARR